MERRSRQTIIPDDSKLSGLQSEKVTQWVAVIAFHPDTHRIGEHCRILADADTFTLGRDAPDFAQAGGAAPAPLNDPYVSRAACSFTREDGVWRLCRESGRSRLRVDGREHTRPLLLGEGELRQGLILTLGMRVVIYLRLQDLRPQGLPNSPRPRVENPPVDVSSLAADHREALQLSAMLPGVSEAMLQLREAVRAAAASGEDVLLIGPTGTGKERVARAIHALATDAGAPWVAVNMAALPGEIAAASLFGVRRGAYTGADSHRDGFFQQAQGGTLFLDEVGDTPPSVQPQLLRALQERELQVLGGPAQRVELRVVSAMETDPDVFAGALRASLRFRLGAQEIRLPPLAERREDIGLHAAQHLQACAAGEGREWRPDPENNAELMRWARCFELLLRYHWPGNVRELLHRVAQIYAASPERLQVPAQVLESLSAVVTPDETLSGAQSAAPAASRSAPNASPGSAAKRAGPSGAGEIPEGPAPDGLGVSEQHGGRGTPIRLADLSEEAFLAVWEGSNREVASVARQLGVSRPAIYRRLKSMSTCRLAADVPLGELLATLDECRGDLAAAAERLCVSRPGLEARLRASGVVVAAPAVSASPD